MDVRLRPAVLTDVPLLQRWDEDPEVRASGDDGWWDWEAELATASTWVEHLIAEEDGRPVGFVQLLDAAAEPTQYWGEVAPGTWAIDIWIGAAPDRGRGIGSRMMGLALARCREVHRATEVLVDPLASNVRAHRFYRRCGFEPVGPRRFGDDDCLVLVHRSPGAD